MRPTFRSQAGSTAETISLRVSRTDGERALKILTQTNIIDPDFQILRDHQHLFFPLLRKPDVRETEALKARLEEVTVGRKEFQTKPGKPKTFREVLFNTLPDELLEDLPHSYDIIGDIAVVNLRPELAKYDTDIAKAIIGVNKNVHVVLARAGAIHRVDRILPTRHLAGEKRTETIHRESGLRFKVDLAKAYFSPRLSHEHQRVVQQVKPGERVVDLFAGVGPFAIMIAKKLDGIKVDAVDVNPEAVRLMGENIRLNKVRGTITTWLGDARKIVDDHLAGIASRVIMNHPSDAISFVDVACKALRDEGGLVHYYTFKEGLDCEEAATIEFEQAARSAGWKLKTLAGVRRVRGTAPMKWQVGVDALVVPPSRKQQRES